MKQNLGVKNWLFPMPVLMIGTYDEDGTMGDVVAPAFACGKELI